MRLAALAADVPGARVLSGGDVDILRLVYDSRQAQAGDLFVAIRGHAVDGHRFVRDVAARGAAVAVEDISELPTDVPALQLEDSRRGLALLAASFYGHPSRRLKLIGVTGTDGKTTVVHMVAHVLEANGLRAAAMSTVTSTTGLTTDDPISVQQQLAAMVHDGFECAVVEASSHALVQQRVAACEFDVAAFTNIGRDHLEYHRTWEAYVEAKATLIDLCRMSVPKGVPKTAVLNQDDPSFAPLSRHEIERRLTYSLSDAADLRAARVQVHAAGSTFTVGFGANAADVELRVPARFNVANALCAAGACLALGLPLAGVAEGLSSFPGATGRLEPVELGQPFRVLIDYAHSGSSLESVLRELRDTASGRLIAVFGSTARSDHDRPAMGAAAAAHSDYFLITTDDPIDEDPAQIAAQIAAGAERGNFEIVLDRTDAIRRAISAAQPGDTVLLAGKGHERFMLFEGRRRDPWDERAAAEAALRARGY